LSLSTRFILLLTFLFSGIAATIWFGVKPAYEASVLDERTTIISEYHRERVELLDETIRLWMRAINEIERDIIDSGNIQNVKTLFTGFHAILPELKSVRITEEGTGKFLEVRSDASVVPLEEDELTLFPVVINNREVLLSWHQNTGVITSLFVFTVQGEPFRILSKFDGSDLQQLLFNHNLGANEQSVLWLNREVALSINDLPNHEPAFESLSRVSKQQIDGVQTTIITSGLSTLPAHYVLYLNQESLQQPIFKLFVQSLWVLGVTFLTLAFSSFFLFRQISKPIKQFINELQPFSAFNFTVPVTPITIPEFRDVSVKMEDIRLKLNHYQKINVEKIISNEERTKLLMEHASDAIAVFDHTGSFTFINAQFKRLFDDLEVKVPASIDDFEKVTSLTILREKSSKSYQQESLLINSISAEIKFTNNLRRDYFYNLFKLDVTTEDKSLIGGQLSLQDLTQQILLDKAKSDMTHFIVHEFKNPLAGIQGLISILKEEPVSEEETQEYYGLIDESLMKLFNFVNRFLQVSQLESLNEILLEPYDISKETLKIVSEFENSANENAIKFKVNSLQQEPVMASSVLMNDMIRNLISNAIKYGNPNRTIDIEIKMIESESIPKITFEITDYGFGIEETERDAVFKKFHRVKKHTYIQGNGLGLAYVKDILNKHGGDISFASNESIGCRFTAWIPYKTLA
jgi:signal transduction histidine kinase/PAS domain-containing protein